MVINTEDQVAKLCALKMPPFPINFFHAMCVQPPVHTANATAKEALYADIIHKVEAIEAFYAPPPSGCILLPDK